MPLPTAEPAELSTKESGGSGRPVRSSEDLDDALVTQLRYDGRAAFSALAHTLRIPRAVVAERVHRLIADGTIRITASVHPELLGLHAMAHLSVRTTGTQAPVVRALVAEPAAVLVSAVSGTSELVVELRLPTLPSLYDTVGRIRGLPDVRRVETLVYVDVPFGILMPDPPAPGTGLDALDRQAIGWLAVDGRMSFAALGERLGMSAPAARRRIVRLRAEGVLRIGATISRRGHAGPVAAGVGINVAGPVEDAVRALADTEGIEFVARTLGRYDLVATLGAGAETSLQDRLSSLRAEPTITHLNSWMHLQVFKEQYDVAAGAAPPS